MYSWSPPACRYGIAKPRPWFFTNDDDVRGCVSRWYAADCSHFESWTT